MQALITGFESFAGRVNPTGKIARELDGMTLDGLKIVGRELPEDFNKLPFTIRDMIRQFEPAIVVGSGWDYISTFKVEKIGLNVKNATFGDSVVPDNYGNKPAGEEIVPGGATALRSSFPAELIVEELKKSGVQAYISYNAGTHCCNTVMYSSLHYLRSSGLQSAVGGFIHVPPTPDMGIEREGVTPMDYAKEKEVIQKVLQTCGAYMKSQKQRGI